jgi:hypothetical protein
MASVASQLIEEVTADAQSDSLEDAREMCADGTYFPNKLPLSAVYWAAIMYSFDIINCNSNGGIFLLFSLSCCC